MELFFGGRWASLCGEWDMPDANVVCREMGFSIAVRALANATYGRSPNGKWNLLLYCTGTESHVLDCPAEVKALPCWNSTGTDASATCQPGKKSFSSISTGIFCNSCQKVVGKLGQPPLQALLRLGPDSLVANRVNRAA